MSTLIRIENLNFSYHNKPLFSNLSFHIEEGDFVCIVGPNGSGKSSLAKMFVGLLPSFHSIYYRGEIIGPKNIAMIRKEVGIVFSDPDNSFLGETVIDDMALTLENMGLPKEEIRSRLDDIYTSLNIRAILDCKPMMLSGGEKQIVALASVLVLHPKVLIIDEGLSMIDYYEKEKLFKLLHNYHKQGMTIILISHDIHEIGHAKHLIGITSSKDVVVGSTAEILSNEGLMKKLSLDMPFMIDLSLKLKLYELIDHIIINKKDMVRALWS